MSSDKAEAETVSQWVLEQKSLSPDRPGLKKNLQRQLQVQVGFTF